MKFLFAFLLLIMLVPSVAPFDPMKTNSAAPSQPPGTVHLMGTDMLGRDVFSRLLHGGRRTILMAAAATLIAVIPGGIIGLGAGYYGGWFEKLVLIFNNAMLAFPGLMLAFVVVTLAGQTSEAVALAVGLAQIAPFIQVARSITLSIKAEAYIESAKALGASERRILRDYIFPNCLPTLTAYTVVIFSYSILNSAALSFLGLAGQPGVPDWGVMLAEGRAVFRDAPWVSFMPGLAITLVVATLNALSRYE